MHDDQDLSSPLVPPAPRNSIAGLVMVTSAALLFGVVAAFVKATALPTLVMLQVRSILEWFLGVASAFAYTHRCGLLSPPDITPSDSLPGKTRRGRNGESELLFMLLVGPSSLWGWLILRAFLYWAFLAGWWLALTQMPIGDATTIVYTGPIWTATFAWLLLNERIDWSFYPIVALDACGIVLITQPSFLGFSPTSTGEEGSTGSYLLGALSSLFSALIAGLLPVCTRKSKECFWTAVNHVSSALSALVFTPLAFVVWFSLDSTAIEQSMSSLGALEQASDSGAFGKWALLVGATVTGFVGLALQTLGYQQEEASKASVMTVLEIPFAYMLQAWIFHDEVSALGLVGVGLVICGTMLNLLRHRQRAQLSAKGC